MKTDLSLSTWCMSKLTSRHAPSTRSRRGRRGDRGPQRHRAAEAVGDADEAEANWFDSSRALAQGLSVTEHDVGLDVLMRATR